MIPGNHDSRNVGYVHFEQLFGDRNSVLRVGATTVVAVDSTEPDLDHGCTRTLPLDRGAVRAQSGDSDRRYLRLPPPSAAAGTGRERNVIYDAGDMIERLQRAGVHLVLSGHKHVPCTPGSSRISSSSTPAPSRRWWLRGNTRPCYNIVEVSGHHVAVWRKHPSTGRSGSSSSPSRRSSTRSTRRGSRTR